MTIYYINGSCFEWKEALGALDRPSSVIKKSANLPVVDASSYISAIVPLPARSGFLMSRLFENPDVIALDFKNASGMSDALDRISYFVENNGRKKIPTQKEIKASVAKMGISCQNDDQVCGMGEGHDLKLQDIALFYNWCRKEGIKPTQGEEELLRRLLENGFLNRGSNADFSAVSNKALIGMSRSHPDTEKRRKIFVHEYSHAKFFTDPQFRKAVMRTWAALKPEEKNFFKSAFTAAGLYTSGEEALLATEVEAHAVDGDFSGFAWPHGVRESFGDIARCEIPLLECKKEPEVCDPDLPFVGELQEIVP